MKDENGAVRYKRLCLNITPTIKRQIQQAAVLEGKTMTDFVVDAVSRYIREITKDADGIDEGLALAYDSVKRNGNHGRTCQNCAWCERDKRGDAPYCTNVRSKYCTEWVDDRLGCEAWEKKTTMRKYRAR